MSNEKPVEKLTYDDGHSLELVVDKINELVDAVNEIDARLTSRMDNHWAYHRRMKREEENKTNG